MNEQTRDTYRLDEGAKTTGLTVGSVTALDTAPPDSERRRLPKLGLPTETDGPLTQEWFAPVSPTARYRGYVIHVSKEIGEQIEKLRADIAKNITLSFGSEESYLLYLIIEGAAAVGQVITMEQAAKAAREAEAQQRNNTIAEPASA